MAEHGLDRPFEPAGAVAELVERQRLHPYCARLS